MSRPTGGQCPQRRDEHRRLGRQLLATQERAPALRQLQQRAPGTYNHSLNVASLAEAAADSIRADGLLAYVGSLYHDIVVIQPSNLSEKTVLLFVALVQVLTVGLLADLIEKRFHIACKRYGLNGHGSGRKPPELDCTRFRRPGAQGQMALF